MSQDSNHLFVLGHPKSGTSLLKSMLDGHPELCTVSEETDFYKVVWPAVKLIRLKWRLSRSEKIDEVVKVITVKSHFFRYVQLNIKEDVSGNLPYQDVDSDAFEASLTSHIGHADLSSRRSVFDAIFSAYQQSLQIASANLKPEYYVEKTPVHTWYIDSIQQDFPNAKFLFVYRDARDNFVSYKKKHGDRLTPYNFSKSWLNAFQEVSCLPGQSCLKIKYENLVASPKKYCDEICRFLSIRFDESMLQPTKLGQSWFGNSMFGDRKKGLDSKSVGRYQSYKPASDIQIIESLTFEQSKRLGYEYPGSGITCDRVLSEFHKCVPYVGCEKKSWTKGLKRLLRVVSGA